MTEHRFTKGVMDYGSGAIVLVESRVSEFRKRRGARPSQLLLHVPTARRIFSELAQRTGRVLVAPEDIVAGGVGMLGGIPFVICTCGDQFGEDQIIDWDGSAEPL